MKPIKNLCLLFLIGMVGLSCSEEEKPSALPTYDIMLNETSLGTVLTNQAGMTLYFFANDVNGPSTCTGSCLNNWQVFSETNPTMDPGLDITKFGNMIRDDGATQVTYHGWPLYSFSLDVKPGDVKGDNVNKLWYVAKSNYSIMLANKQLRGDDGKLYLVNHMEGIGLTSYFTDQVGRTLYRFVNDKNSKNNFTKDDLSNDGVWPIYSTELKELPFSLDKSLFGEISVYGKKQVTFKGWPLYYFGTDFKVKGATKGVSVPKPGTWSIINGETPVAPH